MMMRVICKALMVQRFPSEIVPRFETQGRLSAGRALGTNAQTLLHIRRLRR